MATDVERAMDVLRRAVSDEEPMILAEYGPDFKDKYIFCRLDWIRTSAGALGHDTSKMRDPRAPTAEEDSE